MKGTDSKTGWVVVSLVQFCKTDSSEECLISLLVIWRSPEFQPMLARQAEAAAVSCQSESAVPKCHGSFYMSLHNMSEAGPVR